MLGIDPVVCPGHRQTLSNPCRYRLSQSAKLAGIDSSITASSQPPDVMECAVHAGPARKLTNDRRGTAVAADHLFTPSHQLPQASQYTAPPLFSSIMSLPLRKDLQPPDQIRYVCRCYLIVTLSAVTKLHPGLK